MGKFQNPKQIEGPFYLFCAFTLAGTSVLAAEYVSVRLGTFTITAVSQFFALLFLLPLCRGKIKSELNALSRKDYVFLFLQALFGMFLFRMFLIIGLTRTSAGEAGILTGATPAITAVLARLALKEPTGGKKFIGILSTVGGVFLIQGLLTPGTRFSMEHFSGNMLVLCAAACESLFNVLSRLFARSDDTHALHPAVQTALVSTVTMILCLVPAAFEDPLHRLQAIGHGEWFCPGLVRSICNGAGFYILVRRHQPLRSHHCRGLFRYDAVYVAALIHTDPGGTGRISAVGWSILCHRRNRFNRNR